jgi:hypothetical protein
MRRRLIAVSATASLALGALVQVAPAGADVGDSHGGGTSGGSYSAWAYYVSATGGGSITGDNSCQLTALPDQPAHYEYNVVSYDGGATYTVWYDCVADGQVLEDSRDQFPDDLDMWQIIDSWVVTPADPEEMIAQAISTLNPDPPAITTDPGGGVPGLVGIPTYLSFTAPVGREEAEVADGPIRVEIWADPTGEVTWDTGDGLPACNAPEGPAGECAHDYSESSVGASGTHLGLPAYTITAEVAYTGGYAVYANGAYVGGSDDIGTIYRTSETTLAVNEAQAINTNAGG